MKVWQVFLFSFQSVPLNGIQTHHWTFFAGGDTWQEQQSPTCLPVLLPLQGDTIHLRIKDLFSMSDIFRMKFNIYIINQYSSLYLFILWLKLITIGLIANIICKQNKVYSTRPVLYYVHHLCLWTHAGLNCFYIMYHKSHIQCNLIIVIPYILITEIIKIYQFFISVQYFSSSHFMLLNKSTKQLSKTIQMENIWLGGDFEIIKMLTLILKYDTNAQGIVEIYHLWCLKKVVEKCHFKGVFSNRIIHNYSVLFKQINLL